MRGAPDSFVRTSLYEDDGAPLNVSEADIATLVDPATTQDERNRLMDKITASIDVRYLDFRHSIMANRKHFSAATGVLGTLSNIASTLTDSSSVKTNYAQLGLLIGGFKTQVDSTYLFDQTVLAIVHQMDSDRAAQYLVMLKLKGRTTKEFSGASALQACISYFHAGTVLSAVSGISKSTAENAKLNEGLKAKVMGLTP